MPIVHMLGVVLPPPPFVDLTLTDLPQLLYKPTEAGGLEIAVTVKVTSSLIDVECSLNRFQDDDIGQIHKISLDLARASINLVSFLKGYGLSVYLHTLIKPDGVRNALLPENPQLASICTAFTIGPAAVLEQNTFHKVVSLVFTEPDLFMALDDLILSQSQPHHGPVTCARAVEGIRNMIAPNVERKIGWKIMNESLRLDRTYSDLITSTSTGGRHGDRTFVPGNVTMEIQRRSWVVMNRFLEFRKRGSQPLPESEFPILSS